MLRRSGPSRSAERRLFTYPTNPHTGLTLPCNGSGYEALAAHSRRLGEHPAVRVQHVTPARQMVQDAPALGPHPTTQSVIRDEPSQLVSKLRAIAGPIEQSIDALLNLLNDTERRRRDDREVEGHGFQRHAR